MSLVGFRHLPRQSSLIELGSTLEFRVASLPALAFLKVVAFEERPADRTRDLEDIAFLLEVYELGTARRFSDAVVSARVIAESAGAFLLGADMTTFLGPSENQLALGFIRRIMGLDDGGHTERRMTNVAPSPWREDPDRIRHMMRAWEAGLRSTRSSVS